MQNESYAIISTHPDNSQASKCDQINSIEVQARNEMQILVHLHNHPT